MENIVDTSIEDQLKERFVIRDLQNEGFSHYTTVDGIFNLCSKEFKKGLDSDEIQEWESDYSSYSDLDKKNFVEIFFDYKIEDPTPDLIAEWEEYHDISWTSNRTRERGVEMEM